MDTVTATCLECGSPGWILLKVGDRELEAGEPKIWVCLHCMRVLAVGASTPAPVIPLAEPEFTPEGYPTERTLETIRKWPVHKVGMDSLLDFVRRAWKYQLLAYQAAVPGLWCFATGGWSGNEELLTALVANPGYGLMERVELPGGVVVFATSPAAKARLEAAQSAFRMVIDGEGTAQ